MHKWASVVLAAILSVSQMRSQGSATTVSSRPPDAKVVTQIPPGCKPPVPVYHPVGAYYAFSNGTSRIVLDVVVSETGQPLNVEVVSGSSSSRQAVFAIQTVKTWRFKAAECGGNAKVMTFRFTYEVNVKSPDSGLDLPEAPPNPAIVGLPNHVSEGLSLVVSGVPTVPAGCEPPRLVEKHDATAYKADLTRALRTEGKGLGEILAGGYAEVAIGINAVGMSGGDSAGLRITEPSTPHSQVLERILSSNLESWEWRPAVCRGPSTSFSLPHSLNTLPVRQVSVYAAAVAYVHYEFRASK